MKNFVPFSRFRNLAKFSFLLIAAEKITISFARFIKTLEIHASQEETTDFVESLKNSYNTNIVDKNKVFFELFRLCTLIIIMTIAKQYI